MQIKWIASWFQYLHCCTLISLVTRAKRNAQREQWAVSPPAQLWIFSRITVQWSGNRAVNGEGHRPTHKDWKQKKGPGSQKLQTENRHCSSNRLWKTDTFSAAGIVETRALKHHFLFFPSVKQKQVGPKNGPTHPVQAAQVLHWVLISVWVIVDHGVLLVHTARLQNKSHAAEIIWHKVISYTMLTN